ncbi:hypothetical protein NDU88_007346 [Pleurodeles waltl]|uniref:Uncharacterized protein n=1 Tax=Pleurodeles waltl TaxID=8319 RepID=A0AAV7PTS6_PLEWA|nr:hypothetical protein NDU88_007346 [Pleurodeles waltl]
MLLSSIPYSEIGFSRKVCSEPADIQGVWPLSRGPWQPGCAVICGREEYQRGQAVLPLEGKRSREDGRCRQCQLGSQAVQQCPRDRHPGTPGSVEKDMEESERGQDLQAVGHGRCSRGSSCNRSTTRQRPSEVRLRWE